MLEVTMVDTLEKVVIDEPFQAVWTSVGAAMNTGVRFLVTHTSDGDAIALDIDSIVAIKELREEMH